MPRRVQLALAPSSPCARRRAPPPRTSCRRPRAAARPPAACAWTCIGFSTRVGADVTRGGSLVLGSAFDVAELWSPQVRLRPSFEFSVAGSARSLHIAAEVIYRFQPDRAPAIPYAGIGARLLRPGQLVGRARPPAAGMAQPRHGLRVGVPALVQLAARVPRARPARAAPLPGRTVHARRRIELTMAEPQARRVGVAPRPGLRGRRRRQAGGRDRRRRRGGPVADGGAPARPGRLHRRATSSPSCEEARRPAGRPHRGGGGAPRRAPQALHRHHAALPRDARRASARSTRGTRSTCRSRSTAR